MDIMTELTEQERLHLAAGWLGRWNADVEATYQGLIERGMVPPRDDDDHEGRWRIHMRNAAARHVLSGHGLWCADSGESLGRATPDQAAHSVYGPAVFAMFGVAEGHIILIDSEGDVVHPGSWQADQSGVRRVYVR